MFGRPRPESTDHRFAPRLLACWTAGLLGCAIALTTGCAKKQVTAAPQPAPWVECVAFSPDGKTLAAGFRDEVVRIWDVATRKEGPTLKGHAETVSSVAFSPDGKLLATGSWERTVKLWDTATWKELATLQGHDDRV